MEDILNAEVLGGENIRHVWRMGLGDLRRDKAPAQWSSRKKAGVKLGAHWDSGYCRLIPDNSLLSAG